MSDKRFSLPVLWLIYAVWALAIPVACFAVAWEVVKR